MENTRVTTIFVPFVGDGDQQEALGMLDQHIEIEFAVAFLGIEIAERQ